MHGWVLGRKPDGRGVAADVLDSHQPRLPYQESQNSKPSGPRSDRPSLLGGDPGGDEIDKLAARPNHPQGAVAGICDLGGQVDDPLQHHRQRQLGCKGESRLQERVLRVTCAGGRVTLASRDHRPYGRGATRGTLWPMKATKGFERILLATDGSEQADAAVEASIATARPVLVAERIKN